MISEDEYNFQEERKRVNAPKFVEAVFGGCDACANYCRRSDIMSHELWSEAAPLLVQYWATHGFGITSRNSALRWDGAVYPS